MTNYQLIAQACIDAGIYSTDFVTDYMSRGLVLPIHTFAEWKKRGFCVRKGEHASLTTQLWRLSNRARRANQSEPEEQDTATEVTAINREYFYLTKCHMFTFEQVEPLKA